jgi:hypothetical protein
VRRSGRARVAALGAVALLVVAGFAAAHVLTPRTEGVAGDWSAPSADGTVVAGRALVSGGNTALDLRTGTMVTLGSVVGGVPYVADERLVIASRGRLDSVRLDASARWTWRPPSGATVVPLAANGGSTLVATCPEAAATPCRLVGLDARGHVGWESQSSGTARPVASSGEALPRTHAEKVPGGGLLLTDPVTGRQVLQPGSTFLAVPDGPVVVPVEQDGQCVVSATTAADPLWTRVLGPCPAGELPQLSATPGAVRLQWPGQSRALDLVTGKDTTTPPSRKAPAELARTDGLVATRRDVSVRTDPLCWGDALHTIELRRVGGAADAEPVARIVSAHRLDLLLLEPRAVVVRVGDRVVRYALDPASATLEP